MTGQKAGGGSSEGCDAFQADSTGGGRPAGLCPSRHRRLLMLVLLEELRVHLLVELGLILEALHMLHMVLLVVVELRGGRRDSVLAHDAAAGSLWVVVDEGSHHGGGTKWVAEKPGCVCYAWVWAWVSKCLSCVCWHRLNIGEGGVFDALRWLVSLARTRPRPRGRDKKKETP